MQYIYPMHRVVKVPFENEPSSLTSWCCSPYTIQFLDFHNLQVLQLELQAPEGSPSSEEGRSPEAALPPGRAEVQEVVEECVEEEGRVREAEEALRTGGEEAALLQVGQEALEGDRMGQDANQEGEVRDAQGYLHLENDQGRPRLYQTLQAGS